jgi:hypothetical protein
MHHSWLLLPCCMLVRTASARALAGFWGSPGHWACIDWVASNSRQRLLAMQQWAAIQ